MTALHMKDTTNSREETSLKEIFLSIVETGSDITCHWGLVLRELDAFLARQPYKHKNQRSW